MLSNRKTVTGPANAATYVGPVQPVEGRHRRQPGILISPSSFQSVNDEPTATLDYPPTTRAVMPQAAIRSKDSSRTTRHPLVSTSPSTVPRVAKALSESADDPTQVGSPSAPSAA